MSSPTFTRQGFEVIYDGFMVQLGTATVEAPDGSLLSREIVRHPGAVAVVAVDRDGSVILERQYRAALDSDLLEIPAGKRDVEDEPAQEAARRELIEETGVDAATWVELGSFYNSPGFTDEHTTVFLATELTEVGADLQGPEEQAMEIVRVPLRAVPELIASGELVDGKSVIGLLLARRHLGE